MRLMKKEIRALQLECNRLRRKIEVLTERKGVYVDEKIEEDLVTIMRDENDTVVEEFPENSLQRIFWQQQKDALKRTRRGCRWHPLFIKFCLFLRHKSSGAYELLRNSGCLQLPSQRTLRDYTHHIKSSAGFNEEVDLQLINTANVEKLKEHEKLVGLILDEMHVKEDLVYDKWTGELIGFMNLDEISSHLSKLENDLLASCSTDDDDDDEDDDNDDDDNASDDCTTATLANSVLVFMVRGLFTTLQFPYATFPCNSNSAEQIIVLFIQAVFRVERCGLRVTTVTCDGLSANRKFFTLIGGAPSTKIVYKAKNPVDRSRFIYLMCDPPHLLKTARNCLANSKRRMQVSILSMA